MGRHQHHGCSRTELPHLLQERIIAAGHLNVSEDAVELSPRERT
jgi:hypothetical protein